MPFRISNTKYRKAPGYTLNELLVVIIILALLIAFGTYTFENAQKKGRDSRRKEDLKSIKSALVLYYTDHKAYPGFLPGRTYASNNMGSLGLMPEYTPTLPKDPKQTTTPAYCTSQRFIYCYQPISQDTFILWGQIENTNDREIIGKPNSPCTLSPLPPAPSASFNYCITNPN